MPLNKDQEFASELFLRFIMNPAMPEMVITGAGGTGKTHLTRDILDNLPNQTKLAEALGGKGITSVFVTATTNKAASVVGEATNEDAATIHSFLNLRVQNDFKTGRTILSKSGNYEVKENTLIIIDECSMIDSELLLAIREATKKCKILYLGDHCQLAPIYEPISKVFLSGIPTAVLKESMRFQGALENLANQLRETVETGIFKPIKAVPGIIDFLEGEEAQEYIDSRFKDDPVPEETKVVAYSNSQVGLYNAYVREEMHGYPEHLTTGEYVVSNEATKIPGAKGQMLKIDSRHYVVSVGDTMSFCGIDVRQVTLSNGFFVYQPNDPTDRAYELKRLAGMKAWPEYFRMKEEVADLRPVHSCTGHKSQGSTYDETVIDLGNIGSCRNPADLARLMYVAGSRARKRVVFIGELPAKYQDSKGVPLFEPIPVISTSFED